MAQAMTFDREHTLGRIERVALSLWILWLAAVQFLQWPAFLYPIFPKFNHAHAFMDSAVFALAGDLLRHGGTPYVSYWDHKPPLIHLINAGALTISHGHLWGLWAASLTTLIAALVLGHRTLRRAFGVLPAVFGMTFFVVALPAILASNLTEEYVLPIQWASALVLVRWKAFEGKPFSLGLLLGVLGALGFLLRPNLIGASVSVFLVLSVMLLTERRFRAWVRCTAGGIGGVALVGTVIAAYLVRQGSFADFWDQVFHYNFVYSATTWKLRIRSAHSGLMLATLYAPLLLPAAGWLLSVHRLRESDRRHPLHALFLLGVIWLPIELLLASIAGREYGHYFIPLLPPLSFLTGLLASEVSSNMASFSGTGAPQAQRLIAALSTAMAIFPVTASLADVHDKGLPPKRMEQALPMIQYIRRHTTPEERIFVWGHAPDLYFFSGRRPATRFIYPFPLLTPGYADRSLVQRFLDDLRASPPSLIIETSPADRTAAPAAEAEPTGEGLVPTLAQWDPEWRHPDPRRPEFAWWRGPSWWTIPPGFKAFYDFVSEHYTVAAYIGPRKWTVYRRRDHHAHFERASDHLRS